MKILLDIVIIAVIGVTALFIYQEYRDDIWRAFINEETHYTVYIDDVALSVSVADTPSELEDGLSGVTELPELGGELFIFPDDQRHGIWMKDMEISLDIMWFNSNLELVHIEREVDPSTFPAIFAPRADARFVIETNSHLVDSLQIKVGDRLTLPSSLLPSDIKKNLQE